jgi:uncharacterized membrane protein YfcA
VTLGADGAIFAISILAGLVGALAGVGGGILIVPALTLLFGIDIRLAIGASIPVSRSLNPQGPPRRAGSCV